MTFEEMVEEAQKPNRPMQYETCYKPYGNAQCPETRSPEERAKEMLPGHVMLVETEEGAVEYMIVTEDGRLVSAETW